MPGDSQGNEIDMKAVGERLRKARQAQGWSLTRLANEIGASPSHLSSMEHGRVGTSLRNATKVARALRVSLDYLMGFSDDRRSSKELLQELETRSAELRAIKEAHTEGEYIAIAEVDTSAGAGAVVNDETVTGHMKFPYRWLRNRGMRPAACRIIRVTGDSMEPTLPNGCAILVYLGSRGRQDGKVFVIRIGDDLVVKRTILDPEKGWLLVSDSPNKNTWVTRPWPEEADIIGEVRWVGSALP